MQPLAKSLNFQRVGSKPSRQPTSQRACVTVRSCVSSSETSFSAEQCALKAASFLTSTIVTMVSASAAFADEAVIIAPSTLAVETASALETVNNGAEGLDISPKAEVAVVAEAPPVAEPVVEAVEAPASTSLAVAEDSIALEGPASTSSPADIQLVSSETVAIDAVELVAAEAVEPVAVAAAGEVTAGEVGAPLADEPRAVEVAVEPVVAVVAAEDPVPAAVSVAPVAVEGEGEQPVVAAEAPADVAVEAVQAVVAPEVVTEAPAIQGVAEEPEVGAITPEPTPVEVVNATVAAEPVVEVAIPGPVEPVPVVPAVEAKLQDAVPAFAAADAAAAAEAVAPAAAALSDLAPVTEPEAVELVLAVEPVVSAADTPAATEPAAASGSDLPALFGAASAAVFSGEGASAETLTYGALGAAALSFVGTFFVAPRFKEAFKEPVDWRDMYAALAAKGVKTVTAEEAYAKAKKGAVILDVRLADDYSKRAAEPSVNVPLYQPIAGWDAASNIRRAGFAFFGIFGTELNENFAADVAAKIPKNKEVIVMCETGGSIENKPGTQFGFQSRSLKALYYLQQAGYTKVLHMKGGLGDWQRASLPLADGASQQKPQQPVAAKGSRRGTTAGTSSGTGRGTSSGRVGAKELVSATTRGRK